MSPSTPPPDAPGGRDDVEDAGTHQVAPRTPERRAGVVVGKDHTLTRTPTAILASRPQQMKDKVEALVGAKSCILTGFCHKSAVVTAHWLQRELRNTNRALYDRVEAAIGDLILMDDGTCERRIFLDSSTNQVPMSPSVHSDFDGSHGFGTGTWGLVPVLNFRNLERIRTNPQMSARQWFPERTHLYKVHVFEGEGPLVIARVGPPMWTYEHLADGPTTEQIAAEDAFIAAHGLAPDHVKPHSDPNQVIAIYTIDPSAPHNGDFFVRIHINPANVYTDIMWKLICRLKKCKDGNLPHNDRLLYMALWPTLRYWFEDGKPLGATGSLPVPVPDDPKAAPIRRSKRLSPAETAPAPKSAPQATRKKRQVADTAPAVVPSSEPSHPRPARNDTVPAASTEPIQPSAAAVKRKRSVRGISTAATTHNSSQHDKEISTEQPAAPSDKKKRRLRGD
ncbi:hypothetical protein HDZ31DRAFT_37454 [Schizophyllum fasciatum]